MHMFLPFQVVAVKQHYHLAGTQRGIELHLRYGNNVQILPGPSAQSSLGWDDLR